MDEGGWLGECCRNISSKSACSVRLTWSSTVVQYKGEGQWWVSVGEVVDEWENSYINSGVLVLLDFAFIIITDVQYKTHILQSALEILGYSLYSIYSTIIPEDLM